MLGFQVLSAGVSHLLRTQNDTCMRRASAVRSDRRVVVKCTETSPSTTVVETRKLDDLATLSSLEDATGMLNGLAEAGKLKKWNTQKLAVRNVSVSELKMVTKLDADSLGLTQKNTVDLKLAFYVVVGGSTALAVLCQSFLTGDLQYFSTYLVGGISLAFLAVGSTAPALLTPLITAISAKFRPDFKDRLLQHEAGHFLAGYLCGVPIEKYDINPISTAVQFYGSETAKEDVTDGRIPRKFLDSLSVVALAGPVSETIKYENAEGGMADLMLLQALFLRTRPSLGSKEQQEQTRWAAIIAYSVLKKHKKELDALLVAMKEGKSVADCIRAIESA